MIVLATSETITLTTSTGTVIVDVTYGDRSGSTFAEGSQRTSVTGTSTIVDAPNSGNRLVKNIYIKPSVTATITLTVDGAALLAKSVEGGATIDLLNDASFTLLAISQVSGLQAALDLKAPLASPALTGVPTAPTAAADTDTTQIATTAFAKAEADAAQAFAIQRANHTGTQLASTISDFASAALSATDSAYVNISGTETITGAKTFSNGLTVSSGTAALQAATVTTLTASGQVYSSKASAAGPITDAGASLKLYDPSLGAGLFGMQTSGSPFAYQLQVSEPTMAAFFPLSLNPRGGSVLIGGLTSITTSTAMTAPASNAVHITDGKVRCGNTSATSIETAGGVRCEGMGAGVNSTASIRARIRGLGSTSSTYALYCENSSVDGIFLLQDDGLAVFNGSVSPYTPGASETLIGNGIVDVGTSFRYRGTKLLGAQGAAVADATDAASVIARLNDLLARLRAHGLIAT